MLQARCIRSDDCRYYMKIAFSYALWCKQSVELSKITTFAVHRRSHCYPMRLRSITQKPRTGRHRQQCVRKLPVPWRRGVRHEHALAGPDTAAMPRQMASSDGRPTQKVYKFTIHFRLSCEDFIQFCVRYCFDIFFNKSTNNNIAIFIIIRLSCLSICSW